MLLPRRFKYRKQQRGRRAGPSKGHAQVQFGEYGLKALEDGWITNRQIEAARIAMTRKIRRGGKVWITIFPDKPVTQKPLETRMGSGKGPPERWVAVVKPGRVMFELAGVPEPLAREAIRLAAMKLPVRSKFVKREGDLFESLTSASSPTTSSRNARGGAEGAVQPAFPARHGSAREHDAPRPGEARDRAPADDPARAGTRKEGVDHDGRRTQHRRDPGLRGRRRGGRGGACSRGREAQAREPGQEGATAEKADEPVAEEAGRAARPRSRDRRARGRGAGAEARSAEAEAERRARGRAPRRARRRRRGDAAPAPSRSDAARARSR